jgi:hypothetical protein
MNRGQFCDAFCLESSVEFCTSLLKLSCVRSQGLIVKGTAFESLPLQTVTVLTPMAPETEVVSLSGGLKTNTSTAPGCAISAAVIAATKRSLLMKLVTRKEPFQLTAESRRKSLPSTLNRKLLPPAVALLGEMPRMEGRGTQTPPR